MKKFTSLFGRNPKTAPSMPPDIKERAKYMSEASVRAAAKRQLALLEAIAVEPGKTANHYARVINSTPHAVECDLRLFHEDGLVIAYPQPDSEKIWVIKSLEKDLKPCTLS
jgi:hypothetical protein